MLPNNLTSPIPKRNTFSLSSTCTHAKSIRYTSQIRSLTIRPRDEYELRRPRAAISALTDRPSLGRETLRFPSSLVRSVADAARELPTRGSSEKRNFARIRGGGPWSSTNNPSAENSRPGCDHGQVRGVNSANRKPERRCRRSSNRVFTMTIELPLSLSSFVYVRLSLSYYYRSRRLFDRSFACESSFRSFRWRGRSVRKMLIFISCSVLVNYIKILR